MRDREQIAPGKGRGQGGSKGQGEAQEGACSDVPGRLHGVMAVTGRWNKPVDSRCCETISDFYLYLSLESSRSACWSAGAGAGAGAAYWWVTLYPFRSCR